MRPRIVLCALLLVPRAGAAGPEVPDRAGLRILTAADDGWVLDYRDGPVHSSPVLIDGAWYRRFDGCSAVREGVPLLPAVSLNLGIPYGATVSATLSGAEYATDENQLIAPAPRLRSDADGAIAEEYLRDHAAYARPEFLPETELVATGPVIVRHQLVATIHLRPYRYSAATRRLRRLLRGTITVRLHRGDAPAPGALPADSSSDDLYARLLANSDQARQWRGLPLLPPPESDSTRSWYRTGHDYYRVRVAEDGWYRVTRPALAAAGADTLSIDTATIQLFGNGTLVPLDVTPMGFEFRGSRNRGDSTDIDPHTDTSAYWLTWGLAPGAGFVPVSPPGGTPEETTRTASTVRHFEENTGYYAGSTQLEVIESEDVPGEGWYWERLYPSTTVTLPFLSDAADPGGGMVTLRVRLFSMTADSPGVDHHAAIQVNGLPLRDIRFEGRTGITVVDSFPATWLRGDTSRLTVTSIPTASFPNLFYLDRFSVRYDRMLSAREDRLEFDMEPGADIGIRRFVATGFRSPDIRVFDVRGARRITGGIVMPDTAGRFSIAFADRREIAARYLIIAPGGVTECPPIARKQFRDIRTPLAPNLLITHTVFRTAADRLAAHRRAAGTAVIDVQDVYDEFNFGVTDPSAIRAFLRQAHTTWGGGGLSSLLLFGDASWDPHGYLSTSLSRNFIPAHGFPSGDNWFASFDSTGIPAFSIGRLPVQDSIQALRTVEKIIAYESTPAGEWNKNFLMITGGLNEGEQQTFNVQTEGMIGAFIEPPPLGGTAYRVYKSSPSIIDGEHREHLRELFRNGLVFVNFLGHSGGRTWNVDVGSPHDLENSDGRLPFVSSVSCNVGAFAEPSGNVLGEDFVLADGRGAIASWASSSLGYPSSGVQLVRFFLAGAVSVFHPPASLGALTTAARIQLYLSSPGDPVARAMLRLTPLLGDPQSHLAVPWRNANFEITPADISLSPARPLAADTGITVRLKFRNFGLVHPDSISIDVMDEHAGGTRTLARGKQIRPIFHRDSLDLPWPGPRTSGVHRLTATIDPEGRVTDPDRINNSASVDVYLYASTIAAVSPLNNQVVAAGPRLLKVTTPQGTTAAPPPTVFEIDTTTTFDSPFHRSSGAVPAGPVTAEWTTPPLPGGAVFYWRARTELPGGYGEWVGSCFSTGPDVPLEPRVRLREQMPGQFELSGLVRTQSTDSGVTLAARPTVVTACRSLGGRSDAGTEYFSTIRVNEFTLSGLWWVTGSGFIAARVNAFTGDHEFRSFDLPARPSEADSMALFIEGTPDGDFLAFAVVLDGRTNMTERLLRALESLGSTQIRAVTPGASWALVGRKGSILAARESLTADSAVVSLQLPGAYSSGSGLVLADRIFAAVSWDSLAWRPGGPAPETDLRFLLVDEGAAGRSDTLIALPRSVTQVDLSFLDTLTGVRRPTVVRPIAFLWSTVPELTPVLRGWDATLIPPTDLALNERTVEVPAEAPGGAPLNVIVTVYNIGPTISDTALIEVASVDGGGGVVLLVSGRVDSLAPGGLQRIVLSVPALALPPRATLRISLLPSGATGDLIESNNIATVPLRVTGGEVWEAGLFADGVELADGDYLTPHPDVEVRLRKPGNPAPAMFGAEVLVDGEPARLGLVPGEAARLDLQEGSHEILARLFVDYVGGAPDTLERRVHVRVESAGKVLWVYNYPNPFSRETEFVFMVSGSDAPDEAAIRIFSAAGRKIQQLDLPAASLRIGFNRVPWDGRDRDGDEVANGVYFYQLSVRRGDLGETTPVQKLVRVR